MRLRRAFFAEVARLRKLKVGYDIGARLQPPVKALAKAFDKFLISIKIKVYFYRAIINLIFLLYV
jgi:hypothetical protein